jgi:hypothetical protein
MTNTNEIEALVEKLNKREDPNYKRINETATLLQQKITLEPRLLKIALYSYLLICGDRLL